MYKFTYPRSVPETLFVACSGGVDSIAMAASLSEWRKITLCHFSHSDYAGEYERSFVEKLSKVLGVEFLTKDSGQERPPGNKEAMWREDRYQWFHSLPGPVAVAHTLDDAVEWYLMTCLRGQGEFMTYENKNVIRPFILEEKTKLKEFAMIRGLGWWEDPGNQDPNFSLRSRVRNCLAPVAVSCEPGLKQMVRRNLLRKITDKVAQ